MSKVSNLFLKFKKEGKYFDLCILLKTMDNLVCGAADNQENPHKIFCHKIIVCEKSNLINKLVKCEQEKNNIWPPVNIIDIQCPSNIDECSMQMAIDYLYDMKFEIDDNVVTHLLTTLMYLSVDTEIIISVLQKYLPYNQLLAKEQASILFDILREDKINENNKYLPLISFYYRDLYKYDLKLDSSLTIPLFGKELELSELQEIYTKKANKKFNNLGEYAMARDRKWLHMPSDSCGSIGVNNSIKFEAFGIEWSIKRFIYSFGYNDNEDFVKLYVDEKWNPSDSDNNKIAVRATFIIYSEKNLPKIELVQKKKLNPTKYKLSYMKTHYKSNPMGFAVPDFDEDRLRFSLCFELL